MVEKRDTVLERVRLRRDQIVRLRVIREAMQEKLGRPVTMSELMQRIVDDFLESPDEK